MAEILSGGLNWGSTQQAIVTMDKEGHPLTCCNPVTGECLGGGGSSDFSTATLSITNNSNETIDVTVPIIGESGGIKFITGYVHANKNTETSAEIIIPTGGLCGGILYKDVLGELTPDLSGLTIETSGDIEYEEGEITISGNGAITISAQA